MIYLTSSSTGNRVVTINVVFKLGINLNNAQVQVQNRVASAEPRRRRRSTPENTVI